MKRLLIVVLLTMISISCGPKNGTGSGNLDISRADFKRITIVLSETPAGIVIEGPIPDEAVFSVGRKVKWTVINNTSKKIESLVIKGFNDGSGNTQPFEGSAADQEFLFGIVVDGEESEKFSTKLKSLNPGETIRKYKYMITVKMENQSTPIQKDPKIIIVA